MSDDFGLWDVFLSIFWFMLLICWIWMLIAILSDIFRDHELSGWGKALWTFFLIIIPWLGALVYLIARGGSMNQAEPWTQPRPTKRTSVPTFRETAGTTSAADEIAKLAQLRENGTITAEEYEQAKAKVLA